MLHLIKKKKKRSLQRTQKSLRKLNYESRNEKSTGSLEGKTESFLKSRTKIKWDGKKEHQAKNSIWVIKAPDRAEETEGKKHQWHNAEKFPRTDRGRVFRLKGLSEHPAQWIKVNSHQRHIIVQLQTLGTIQDPKSFQRGKPGHTEMIRTQNSSRLLTSNTRNLKDNGAMHSNF